MATVAVKNVDEQLYRTVKALASLQGRTMGEVANEALRMWVQLRTKVRLPGDWVQIEEEARANNRVYEREEANLLAGHRGEYVAVAKGQILGTFADVDSAYAVVDATGARHGIVTRLEPKPQRVIELGWSILEQLA